MAGGIKTMKLEVGFVLGVTCTIFVGYQVHKGIEIAKNRIQEFKADLHEMPMLGDFFKERFPLEPTAYEPKRFLDFQTETVANYSLGACITLPSDSTLVSLRCDRQQTLFAPVSGTIAPVPDRPGQYDFTSQNLPTVRIRFAQLDGVHSGEIQANEPIAVIGSAQNAAIATYQFDGTQWHHAPTPQPLIDALFGGTVQ